MPRAVVAGKFPGNYSALPQRWCVSWHEMGKIQALMRRPLRSRPIASAAGKVGSAVRKLGAELEHAPGPACAPATGARLVATASGRGAQ